MYHSVTSSANVSWILWLGTLRLLPAMYCGMLPLIIIIHIPVALRDSNQHQGPVVLGAVQTYGQR